MKIRTDYARDGHPDVLITLHESEPPTRACGYSWCEGQCGLPAAVIPDHHGEFKMYSNMTACGPVMQRWRTGVTWRGERFTIPEEFRAWLLTAYWL